MTREEENKFTVVEGIEKLDFDLVHAWLSKDAYWSKGISRELVVKSFQNSLSFGVFLEGLRLVGIARLVTDKATFSYLGDVFIDPEFRGQGVGKLLMNTISSHPELQGLRRQMLATYDAHDLYAKYGYAQLSHPDRLMEKLES